MARLGKSMRREGFRSYEQYCRHVEADPTGRPWPNWAML